MFNICDKEKCSGCGACLNVCPNNCISMVEENGFNYPKIEIEKCIHCSLCKKTCQEFSAVSLNEPIKIYSGVSLFKEMFNSSSGGVAYNLSKFIIEQNGVVFGAIYDDNMEVKHVFVNNLSSLYKLQGSKYVQSDINITYKQAKQFLEKNRLVLFTGTPCQIGGLYKYVGKEYKNLITVDLLCGGVSSPFVFKKYVNYLEEQIKDKIIDFNFRSKRYGYGYGYLLLCLSSKSNKSRFLKGINSSFIKTLGLGYVRESCFDCKYRSFNRIGDLTIGDFWHLKISEKDFQKGISLILTNTEKGEEILSKLKDIKLIEREREDVFRSQTVSIKNIKTKPKDYNEFFISTKKCSYEELAKVFINSKISLKDRIFDNLPPFIVCSIRNFIRKLKNGFK